MIVLIVPDIIHYLLDTFRVFLHLRCQGGKHLLGALMSRSGTMLLYYFPDSLVMVKYGTGSQCIVGERHFIFYTLEER